MSAKRSQKNTQRQSMFVASMGHRFPDASVETAALQSIGIEVVNLGGMETEAALQAAEAANAVLVGPGIHMDVNALRRLKECRAIVRYGVGVDNIDLAAATVLGITVCNVPDYGVEEVANHTLALLLALARRLDVWSDTVRKGHWGISRPKVRLPRLSSATLGVIGAGRIGQALIVRSAPIWGKILVYDPWVEAEELARIGAEKTALDALLSVSDFITLHAPSTKETRNLLSEEKLKLVKHGAVLVNCSRGDLVDEKALEICLESGQISSAGLDVFREEPPDPAGLVSHPQVWPTPHVAYLSNESIRDLRRKAAEEAGRVLRGESPNWPVAQPDEEQTL